MIAVIFEVWPHPDAKSTYLDIAAALRPELDAIEGFVSIERFQSLADPSKLLSLSFWRDEAAVARWRNAERHRDAQHVGRTSVFRDYRLRIAAVLRDYGLTERDQAPHDSRAVFVDATLRPLRPAPYAAVGLGWRPAARPGPATETPAPCPSEEPSPRSRWRLRSSPRLSAAVTTTTGCPPPASSTAVAPLR